MAAVTSRAAKPLAAAAIAQLESDGVATLIGTVVNPAGLTHAKTIPLRRMGAFADPGLGASPVWHVFAIDQTGIVFSEATGVVGDQRIRIDLGALRILGDGLAWAPGAFFDQDGATGSRTAVAGRWTASNAGSPTPESTRWSATRWSSCSSGPTAAGCPPTCGRSTGWPECSSSRGSCGTSPTRRRVPASSIEQFHPEYGLNQFEISLTPQSPIAAADQLLLDADHRRPGRQAVRPAGQPVPGALRRQRGIRCTPTLFTDKRAIRRVFSGGSGARGMTPEGESAVAGLVAGLPEARGRAVRFHPLRVCASSQDTGPARTSAGAPKTARPQCDSSSAEQQSARRQRRGEGHRPIGEPVLRDGDDPRACARRHRAEAVAATGNHRRPVHA